MSIEQDPILIPLMEQLLKTCLYHQHEHQIMG